MNQRSNIYLLSILGESNDDIYKSLKRVCGDEAYSFKAVQDINDAPRSGRPPDPRNRVLVEAQINEDPYISAHQISRNTCIPYTTVLHILVNDLNFKYRHLRWVPHFLTPEIKEKRVLQAKELLNALQTANRSHMSNIITGDESWFLYVNQPKARWVLAGDNPGDIVAESDYQKKTMVTIFIRKNGTFFVELLPNGQNFNSEYFVDCIIPKIHLLAYPNGFSSRQKKALVHFDNAPSHKSKYTTASLAKYPFKLIPNPIYSPDVSPLDF